MRMMLMIKATDYSETGVKYSPEHTEALQEYKKMLAREGILLAEEELQPSARGIRIAYTQEGQPELLAGPFEGSSKELVAAYYVLDVETEEEAVQWALRMPIGAGGQAGHELELRWLEEKGERKRVPVIEGVEANLKEQLYMYHNQPKGSERL